MGAENDISSFVLLIVPSSLSSSAVSLCSIDKTKSEIISNQIELLGSYTRNEALIFKLFLIKAKHFVIDFVQADINTWELSPDLY